MIVMAFVLRASVISALVIFQTWQATEHRKLDLISSLMSDTFREVRAVRSRPDADIQRYAILTFMVPFVLTSTAITYAILVRYLPRSSRIHGGVKSPPRPAGGFLWRDRP